MKLLTLNCHSWQEDNQYVKIEHLAETIKENSYDVIALQEVSQTVEEMIAYGNIKKDNYALVLLNELKKQGVENYSLVWGFSHKYTHMDKNYEEGLAILTKHPVVEEHSFCVSTIKDINNWKTRYIIGSTIEYSDKPFTFYSCHMGWWHDDEEPFKDQVKNLLQNINRDDTVFFYGGL